MHQPGRTVTGSELELGLNCFGCIINYKIKHVDLKNVLKNWVEPDYRVNFLLGKLI